MTVKQMDVALKSPDQGKLVRACVVVEGDVARNVLFSGDFFLEPAELLGELSLTLAGATAADVATRVHDFFARQPTMMLIGARPEDFIQLVEKALASAS